MSNHQKTDKQPEIELRRKLIALSDDPVFLEKFYQDCEGALMNEGIRLNAKARRTLVNMRKHSINDSELLREISKSALLAGMKKPY